jgi:predicted small metal-binding protein
MLIRYACRDMGLDCTFLLKGETVEEVTRQALEHVLEKHADDFNATGSPEQITQMELALTRSMREVVS